MRLGRVAYGNKVFFVEVEKTNKRYLGKVIKNHPFGIPEYSGETINMSDAKILAPILATKIISPINNFSSKPEVFPNFILKPSTTISNPVNRITVPDKINEIYLGPTIGAVIGRPIKNISEDNVAENILGYVLAADITSISVASIDTNFVRAKSYDSFCPLGPWIDTNIDPRDIVINENYDQVLNNSLDCSEMNFEFDEIISYVSKVMTLLPGDIVLAGTNYSGSTVQFGVKNEISAMVNSNDDILGKIEITMGGIDE